MREAVADRARRTPHWRRDRVCALIGLLTLLLTGCRAEIDFERAFHAYNNAYYGSDEANAIKALTTFVAKAEQHEAAARKAKELNFDAVLGMAWLRISAVHELGGREEQRTQAMAKAIRYFDRLSVFTRDPKYLANREGGLQTLLRETEKAEMPAWKKRRLGKS